MRLNVNGQRLELPPDATAAPVTVERFLREFAPIDAARRAACAVEVNQRLVPRREHATAILADGDTVEVVTLVGGG